MLNLGWSEIFFIMILGIIVIGPNEIPVIMHNLGRIVRRLNYIRFALSQQFDDFLKEHDLHDLKNIGYDVNFEARAKHNETFDEADADEDHHEPVLHVPQDIKHD